MKSTILKIIRQILCVLKARFHLLMHLLHLVFNVIIYIGVIQGSVTDIIILKHKKHYVMNKMHELRDAKTLYICSHILEKFNFYFLNLFLGRNFFRNQQLLANQQQQLGLRRRFWTTEPPPIIPTSTSEPPIEEPEEEEEEEEEEKDQMTAQEQVILKRKMIEIKLC